VIGYAIYMIFVRLNWGCI